MCSNKYFPALFPPAISQKNFLKKNQTEMKYAVYHPYNKSCTAMQFLKPVVEVVRYTLKYHLDQEGFELLIRSIINHKS